MSSPNYQLPPEKVTELRQKIGELVSNVNLESVVDQVTSNKPSKDPKCVSDAELTAIKDVILRSLNNSGMIDKVTQEYFVSGNKKTTQHILARPVVVPHDKSTEINFSLVLRINGGSAFLDGLTGKYSVSENRSYLRLYVNFCGQRFRSKAVPFDCEPSVKETFTFNLSTLATNPSPLLANSNPIHLVLIRYDDSGDVSVLSSQKLDWRNVLSTADSRIAMPYELLGVGSESSIPVGILNLSILLVPKLPQKEILSSALVKAQLDLERNKTTERDKLFLIYSKQWWKEYIQLRESHVNRTVKIFVRDENGFNRPTMSFIHPYRVGRLIETPCHAARFVALIGYKPPDTQTDSGTENEFFSSMFSMLASNQGSQGDHAVLLCNLLLGFGLDAYVCFGIADKQRATWVITRDSNDRTVTCWNPLSSQSYGVTPINPEDPPAVKAETIDMGCPLTEVFCLINHENVYANTQSSCQTVSCDFNLANASKWKRMSFETISSVTTNLHLDSTLWPPLIPSTIDAIVAANDIEMELRILVTQHRKDIGLDTKWDNDLSYVLTQTLTIYDIERLTGVTFGENEFQQAIRKTIPDGHTFKGFPVQYNHLNSRKMFVSALRSSVCESIICCRGDETNMALRVKVVPQPEQVCAVWVMFAVRYKAIG